MNSTSSLSSSSSPSAAHPAAAAVSASSPASSSPTDCRKRSRSPPPSPPPLSSSSSSSSLTTRPSNDFARLLADARERHGAALFSDAATLDALSRCADSLLNPHCGALVNDVLDYHLRPLMRVPQLVVCGAGAKHNETHALPLSAASSVEWVRLEGKLAQRSSVVKREGELLLTGGTDHDCSLLSVRTGRWRDGPSMPTLRFTHCSARLSGVSVVCGGEYGSSALSSTLLLPAGDAAQWAQGCEMTSARLYAGGAVVAVADASAHRMLVAGGADSNNHKLDSCELYDAVADRWSVQESVLPQAMWCHAASIAGGNAVLAVQLDGREKTRCALFDVRSSSPSWQPVSSVVRERRSHAVAAFGEYSVVMLGENDKVGYATNTAQLYDARADRWSERAEWHLPVGSAWHCAAVLE